MTPNVELYDPQCFLVIQYILYESHVIANRTIYFNQFKPVYLHYDKPAYVHQVIAFICESYVFTGQDEVYFEYHILL